MRAEKNLITRSTPLMTLTIRVKPSFISRMRVIGNELASSSRMEAGCLFYFAAESEDTEGLFLISSAWRDRGSYEKHRTSPYVRAFESQIEPELFHGSATVRTWHKLG